MKYIITKTDIYLKGKIHPEGSLIDSGKYTEEEIESIKHLLIPVEKSMNVAITIDNEEENQVAAEEQKPKRPRNPKK